MNHASMVVSIRKIWYEADRFVQVDQSQVGLAEKSVGKAAIRVSVGVGRIKLDRFGIFSNRPLIFAPVMIDDPPFKVCRGQSWIQLDGFIEIPQRTIGIAGARKRQSTEP